MNLLKLSFLISLMTFSLSAQSSDSEKIYQSILKATFTQDKIDKIVALGIDIYLENLKYVADQIENTTDCYGIYVNELPNKYRVQPQYIVDFERLVNGLNGENCGELTAKED